MWGWAVMLCLWFAASASAGRVEDVECVAKCETDLDCSLNGACKGGVCLCDAAWTGPCCSALALLPATVQASGYRHANTSTWGGNIINVDGMNHMWFVYGMCAGNGGGLGGKLGVRGLETSLFVPVRGDLAPPPVPPRPS